MRRLSTALATATATACILTAAPAATAAPAHPGGRDAAGNSVSTAATWETDTAVAGTPPSGLPCKSTTGVTVCFEANGDILWVKDTVSDGYAAIASWENYLRDTSGNWQFYRHGECDNKLSAGHWGYCNKDFYEDTSLNEYGGHGSGLRLYPCTSSVCSTDYLWVRNNA